MLAALKTQFPYCHRETQFSPHAHGVTALNELRAAGTAASPCVDPGLICATGAQPRRDTRPPNGKGGTRSATCEDRDLTGARSNYRTTGLALAGHHLPALCEGTCHQRVTHAKHVWGKLLFIFQPTGRIKWPDFSSEHLH